MRWSAPGVRLRQLRPTKLERPASPARRYLRRWRTALCRGRIESRRANGDDFDASLRFDRRHGVARIDRADERVGGFNFRDLGNLLHVQQRCDARHHVLAEATWRHDQVAVVRRHAGHQDWRRFQQGRWHKLRSSAFSTLATPAILAPASAAAPQSWPATSRCTSLSISARRDGVPGLRDDAVFVRLGEYEDAHQITFASFISLSTSSFTSSTLTPPSRFGGSATETVVEARCFVYAQICRGRFIDRLFLRLHDVRQRCVARLVQTKINS